MYTGYGTDPMPSDKLMKLFIIQSISAFVANDYETGVHFLNEIKQAYAEHMSKLNPTLKQLAKEVIQAVDMFNPDGSAFAGGTMSNVVPEQPAYSEDQQPAMPSFENEAPAEESPAQQPSSVTSELQELLRRRKEKRNRR